MRSQREFVSDFCKAILPCVLLGIVLMPHNVSAQIVIVEYNDRSPTVLPGFGVPFSAGADMYNCGDQVSTWGPFFSFAYQNVPAFTAVAGDILAFDLGGVNDVDIELEIAMVPTTINGNVLPSEPFTTVVSNTQTPENPRGDTEQGNFELRFVMEQGFSFPGGGLIIRFSNPSAAYRLDDNCNATNINPGPNNTADFFVGALVDEDGEFPWDEGVSFIDVAISESFAIFSGGDRIVLTHRVLDLAGNPITVTKPSSTVVYEVTATNGTATDATGVEIVETLPDVFRFVSATTTPAAAAVPDPGPPQTVTWTVGSLAVDETAVLEVTVDVPFGLDEQTTTAVATLTQVDPPLEAGSEAIVQLIVSAIEKDLLSKGDGNCFIATAVYGSYLEPEVKVLRHFRDQHLLTNRWGRAFVHWYYEFSPPYADLLARYDWAKAVARAVLTPVVYSIKFPVAALLTMVSFIIFCGCVRGASRRRLPNSARGDL
jgi:uncharacterized repeat protein (TIGR01451 family)